MRGENSTGPLRGDEVNLVERRSGAPADDMPATPRGSGRFANVDAMRGIAALAVCWFHFTSGNPHFLSDGILKLSGKYGWSGVEMFFVISGFIVPFSLYRANYSIGNFPKFVSKRLVRLDPPYLVSIGIVIALGVLSSNTPGFQGEPFSVSGRQLLVHLAYVNAMFGEEWLNPVFWTLAIEFQYYLLIGVCFPLIAARQPSHRLGIVTILCLLSVALPHERFVFHYLPLFLLGVAVFYLRVSLISWRGFRVLIAVLLAWVSVSLGIVVLIVGASSVALLLAQGVRYPRILLGVGTISYSLYLLHVPIGGRVINLSLRFSGDSVLKVSAIGVALVSSLCAAWVLYRYVEAPAQNLASRISLRVRARGAPTI